MVNAILARIAPSYVGQCEPIQGFVSHGEPVTTESEWLAAWYMGENERFTGSFLSSGAPTVPETEIRWSIKLIESGIRYPFTRGNGGVSPLDLALENSINRVLYSRGSMLRSAIKSLCPRGLLPSSCDKARLVSFAPSVAGSDALPGTAGWTAVIAYVRVN